MPLQALSVPRTAARMVPLGPVGGLAVGLYLEAACGLRKSFLVADGGFCAVLPGD
ncbi:hypothetical protein GGTG_01769 [Gaeumannomyces tritici R3-111a-1]|uniref:Uncharacterized protein n=1 Tax=Gaeumannomyces tritici (strain R3-111a-1) TaxID=644352 RepID=J3NKH7_GAET3|nr:hypothetical protein GGTG_01769 [Gaeumannomyces tritici R3-111a-1]EJT81794.1 hypothetical protein GGTG_01769 [Gaeumannomyces tritici R3-111a-1]